VHVPFATSLKALPACLLKALLPFLRRVVRRAWRNPTDIEDIVQDILLSLHAGRRTYDPDRPFGPWLMAIARNRIADAGRRVARRADHETTSEAIPETVLGRPASAEQDSRDDEQIVRRALAALSPGQRRAVELLKLHGLSLREGSVITGQSVAALKVTMHRSLMALRRILEAEY
jgi:RNA polymerase sigma-70 factor (ECF subfamily)